MEKVLLLYVGTFIHFLFYGPFSLSLCVHSLYLYFMAQRVWMWHAWGQAHLFPHFMPH